MDTNELRAFARRLFDKAVKAADPALAVRQHFAAHRPPAPRADGRTLAIAIGKAAPAMLAEALGHISGPVTALGVTHHENARPVPGATILPAGHPVPDQAGYDAGQRIVSLLEQSGPADQVIALISGGGSALVPAPVPPLTLEDKQAVNRLLLDNGLDITAMNMIRQQLSDLKGGGFLRHAAPAPVTALILSDVIGNDLRTIASGPTVAPLGTRDMATDLLRRSGLFDQMPAPVQTLLTTAQSVQTLPEAKNYLIGSNAQSLHAMLKGACAPWTARIITDDLSGDVAEAAMRVLRAGSEATRSSPTALIFGGETTVNIVGTGRGGRNQELALRVAMKGAALAAPWVFLSGGTDGRDGPTDAAGGIVDDGTVNRIRAAGQDAVAMLANNDSYCALEAAGDLLITGATGTNVADVQVLLLP